MSNLSIDLSDILKYERLTTESFGDLPSDKDPVLSLKLKISDSGFNIMHQNELQDNVDQIFLLFPIKCNIKLETNNKDMEITLISTDNFWSVNQYCYFEKKITLGDIKYLNDWKDNAAVSGRFYINGKVIGLVNSTLTIINIKNDANQIFTLGSDYFENNIVVPVGLDKKYLYEFNLEMPIFNELNLSDTTKYSLIPNLSSLQHQLKMILEEYRKYDDITSALMKIRKSLEVMNETFKDNNLETIANDLYIKTGIFENVPSQEHGAIGASKEVVQSFRNIFLVMNGFNSKAIHFKKKDSDALFKFNPDKYDFEFILNLLLITTNYLIQRIKKACNQ